MTLRIYNTLTRTKEEFRPLDPKNVRMYVCGPTVYDFAHIGNARPAIVFDVLFRLLRHLYGKEHVTYIRNITDVDDKINARALRDYPGVPLNEAIRKVTETTYDQYQKDVKALGCLEPTAQPRATEHIAGMVEMIKVLIARGHAYEAGGEVLFDVSSMPDYGKLSGRKLEEQQAGARVAVEAHKKNPGDFVLWKLSSAEEPGWESPWGRGRPGWHIECSVMSKDALGEVFDIHGGGLDLIFPHHENEIAQSRCAHGTKVMANYWMHNGFLQVEGQKMSKSLGNFKTIHELLTDWPGDVLRLQMLMTHYRQPIDWTWTSTALAQDELLNWASVLQGHETIPDTTVDETVIDALFDDLNTAEALSALREVYLQAKSGTLDQRRKFATTLKFLGFRKIYSPGLFEDFINGRNTANAALIVHSETVQRLRAAYANAAPEEVKAALSQRILNDGLSVEFQNGETIVLVGTDTEFEERVNSLVENRLEARKAKDWKKSDEIRDELLAMGIQIKDNKDGTTSWEVKR